jgi:hypothetical protein
VSDDDVVPDKMGSCSFSFNPSIFFVSDDDVVPDKMGSSSFSPAASSAANGEIQDNDVVCGRGRMTLSHPGNKAFRGWIRTYGASYQATQRRNEKKEIILQIIEHIRSTGGRFMKALDDDHDDDAKPLQAVHYEEASFEFQYEKVGHALRSVKGTSTPTKCPDFEVMVEKQLEMIRKIQNPPAEEVDEEQDMLLLAQTPPLKSDFSCTLQDDGDGDDSSSSGSNDVDVLDVGGEASFEEEPVIDDDILQLLLQM